MDTTDIVSKTILDCMGISRFTDEVDDKYKFFPKTNSRESYFNDPNIIAKIDTAKPIIAAAKKGLLGKDGLELSELSKLGGFNSLKPGDERHKHLLEKYMNIFEVLNPQEEEDRMWEVMREAFEEAKHDIDAPSFLFEEGLEFPTSHKTNREIFDGEEDPWYFREICAQLADFEIERSIANDNLPQKFGSWISY